MAIQIKGLWTDCLNSADSYLAFRGEILLKKDCNITLDILASDWFRAWSDGEMFAQGPARYNLDFPEYEQFKLKLTAGRHIISSLVHHTGVDTRLLEKMEPFWFCRCQDAEIKWKCLPFGAYQSGIRRINPQLDWIEWCDTRKIPDGWQKPDFDDSHWLKPLEFLPAIGQAERLSSGKCGFGFKQIGHQAGGRLAEVFSYEKDDPPTRFFLRDLNCLKFPSQGIWRRYDLGRVRLASPSFVIEAPQGAVVEFGFAEHLSKGRVAPYINCSDGLSANLDHYVAKGGKQQFEPITPKGGRYLEVHILADPEKVKIHQEGIIERSYYDKPAGSFLCDKPLLENIWNLGIETFKACTEDAVTDNPTRERGQWTGDVVSVGMETAAAGFSDLSIFRRALFQAAQSRNERGLVAGMSPGACIHVSSFAAQWVNACLRYYRITGDKKMLEDIYDYITDNLNAFEHKLTKNGLSRDIEWAFIDWGYHIDASEPDTAMDCHYLEALKAATQIAQILGDSAGENKYQTLATRLNEIIGRNVDKSLKEGWQSLGYHSAVLAGRSGFFNGVKLNECIEYVKSHILNSFPENPNGVRLSSPFMSVKDIITPYFSHFAFDFLIKQGQIDFVLDRYKNCWGWVIDEGLTTLPEVFDLRWSHCHQWSACPTWQMSKYCLGLEHRFDKGQRHFDFVFKNSKLNRAEGTIPLPEKGSLVKIKWQKNSGRTNWSIKADLPITIHRIPECKAQQKTEWEFVTD